MATLALVGTVLAGTVFEDAALTGPALTVAALAEPTLAGPDLPGLALAGADALFTVPALLGDLTTAELPEPLPELILPVVFLPEFDLPVLFTTMVASAFTKKTRSLRIYSSNRPKTPKI